MHGMFKDKVAYMVQSVEVRHSMQSREEWRIDVEQGIACHVIVERVTACAQPQDKELSMASVGASADQPPCI